MKKNILFHLSTKVLLLLISSLNVNSQNLASFNNRKIITIVEQDSQSKSIDEEQKGSVILEIGNNKTKATNIRETFIRKKNDLFEVSYQINKIKIESNMNGVENNYDSDNIFERNDFVSVIGNQYDPIIKKAITLRCNDIGNVIDTVGKAINLQKGETKSIPILSNNKLWSFIFINSPKDFIWNVENTWNDSLLIGNDFIVNQYVVKTIKQNIATINLTGNSFTRKNNIKFGRPEDGSMTDSNTKYQGTIKVDLSNNFIQEIKLKKQIESEIKIMGKTTKSLTETNVNLKNIFQ